MDRNMFSAIALCAAIYLAWYQFYGKKMEIQHQQAANGIVQTTTPIQNNVQPSASTEKSTITASSNNQNVKIETITLQEGEHKFTISSKGAVITSAAMPSFKGKKTDDVPHLIGGSKQLDLVIPNPDFTYVSEANYQVTKKDNTSATLTYADDKIQIERTYKINSSNYTVDHDLVLSFKKQTPNFLFVGLRAPKILPKIENERRHVSFSKMSGGTAHWDATGSIDELKEELTEGKWAGISSRYFLSALIDKGAPNRPQFQVKPNMNELEMNLVYKISGNSLHIPQMYFYGPKEIDTLKRVGYGLDNAVDFGWFTIIAYPILTTLKWLNEFVKNYGIAIILLTVLIKILLYPLTFKSMKSMQQMQKFQPQMQALREKYKDDKERLNREMMAAMRTHGYNPMSGCLPIFIQMPVFIALYNVLYGATELYGQPFFGWITDLSLKDPFYVTPVLLGLIMFVQQKITPQTTTDPAQQKMMLMMPVIFGVMMLWLPAGLTLYMLVNSVVSIIQQVIINKQLGIVRAKPAAA